MRTLTSTPAGSFRETGWPNSYVGIDDVDSDERLRPREWVVDHMSAGKSTEILRTDPRRMAAAFGMAVNTDIEVKINCPDCDYYDSEAWSRLAGDYMNLGRYLAA